MIISKVAERY